MKPQREEKVEYFIPAQALEHPTNDAFCDLKIKLRRAIAREIAFGDFFDLRPVEGLPWIIIDNSKFIADAVGYVVSATIVYG